MSNKIATSHLNRRAVVYLRQSTPSQVREHRESTLRQYELKNRAVALGWQAESVEVIDEDLGQSGRSTEGREGFLRLAKDVADGKVGAIFALDVSRLSRKSSDWYVLLDVCRIVDVLIADEQSIFDPGDHNDRMLLGIKGTMSDAEQHWMRLRLDGGRICKARRGELYLQPPTGYRWDEAALKLRFDPDEQVQQLVRLVFERFRIDGSAGGVARYLQNQQLRMPRMTANGDVLWVTPRVTTLLGMLHNPIYAGAYVYGRQTDRTLMIDGKPRQRRVTLQPAEWKVLLKDHHPAYITWDAFMANQEKLAGNLTNHSDPAKRGAARDGSALLQGMVLCGKCGYRMRVRYEGKAQSPRYECISASKHKLEATCWTVKGQDIDDAVAALFLKVVQPPDIELALAVALQVERQASELDRQWKLRLERTRYETRIAERRYKAVDPDNRVVARNLERDWEEKLQELERTEQEYQAVRYSEHLDLTDDDRARILALAQDLPRVWHAPTTSHAHRKTLLRMLVREVSLKPMDVPERQVRVGVVWATGALTELAVRRGPARAPDPPPPPTTCSTADVAARFGVTVAIVRYWIKQGRLTPAAGGGRGRTLRFELDAATVERLETIVQPGEGFRTTPSQNSHSRS